MADGRREFRIDYLHGIREHFRERGQSRLDYQDAGEDEKIDLPFRGFGNTRQDICFDKSAIDYFDQESYAVQRPQNFLVSDCIIRTQYGLVTIDEFLARESAFHFPTFRFPEFKFQGEKYHEISIEIPNSAIDISIPYAFSAQAGIQENYYHWMVLFLGKLTDSFIRHKWQDDFPYKPVVIFPYFLRPAHAESAATLMDHFNLPSLCLERSVSVQVKNLVYPMPVRSGGLRPHPAIKEVFEILKGKFYESSTGYPKQIYISRRDTNNRVLANEAEIEDFLIGRGYQSVCLSKLTLRDQINLRGGFQNS